MYTALAGALAEHVVQNMHTCAGLPCSSDGAQLTEVACAASQACMLLSPCCAQLHVLQQTPCSRLGPGQLPCANLCKEARLHLQPRHAQAPRVPHHSVRHALRTSKIGKRQRQQKGTSTHRRQRNMHVPAPGRVRGKPVWRENLWAGRKSLRPCGCDCVAAVGVAQNPPPCKCTQAHLSCLSTRTHTYTPPSGRTQSVCVTLGKT